MVSILSHSKRSRHSSLWSLEDDTEAFASEDANDMVNYANDPFGVGHHSTSTNAEYAMISRADSEAIPSRSERGIGLDNPSLPIRSTASSFSQTRHASASNEALN